ncbi:unnamed protein product [Gemmataceae bacterium]|nr:unnamed protein product [Gemmataceae bacterium]VTT97218.1 unnamed protein product [Gemmataceae bacterium]
MSQVSHKRYEQEPDASGDETPALVEVVRAGAESAAKPKEDEQMSLFWRVFGGTILSMVALGTITLYNSITSNIAELRGELSREREARAELVKKDEFNSRMTSQYERIRGLDAQKAECEVLKERVGGAAAALDGHKRDAAASLELVRKDLDAIKKEAAAVEVLRERAQGNAEALKAVREEVAALQKSLDQNKVADLERKASRDAQAKLLDDTIKDIQRGLQDCREKIARLEGQRSAGTGDATAVPVPFRGSPGEPKGAGTARPAPAEPRGERGEKD